MLKKSESKELKPTEESENILDKFPPSVEDAKKHAVFITTIIIAIIFTLFIYIMKYIKYTYHRKPINVQNNHHKLIDLKFVNAAVSPMM